MFKSYRNLLSTVAVVALASIPSMAGSDASRTYENGKKVIDGGMTYPVKKGKTSSYHVNTQKAYKDVKFGRTATPNEELQVALMDSNQNVISQKTIRAGSTGSYDTVLLTWQTSARLGFGEYTVMVWSQVDERYDYLPFTVTLRSEL